ncbi:MAG: T9SS type A sorting domain-containing protein [Bacteroidetes bacterium]|nr:T9SS type A sorting domain-containing protein [Bacteroidota bacterium]
MTKFILHCSNAVQSLLYGDNPVFEALAYHKLINPNIDYDDYYTCIQSGVVYRKKDVAQQYCNLYPNPSSGLVFVSYSVATDATLEIINAFGQILVAKKLDPTSTNMKLDISNYLNGIYFYRIHDQQNLINTGKLILTK